MSDKLEFRPQQLARLKAQATQTQKDGAVLAAKLMAIPAWQAATTIALTVASPIEVPTAALIAAAEAAGKTVYLPKTMPHRQMTFLEDPGPAGRITSAYGIPEPPYLEAKVNQQVDLMLVPGIGFATDTHARLGFGGGYYDRFLAGYRGHTITLVPKVMQFATAAWPINDYDVPIQDLILV
ncbi:5-formyltetrahydrofolate cyclo-ligase [Lacticaseibacillus parakribbianus]|uniref:5-formyltetrahydrofolate cyclo-ligase n=1 Tax=Lacticaseibacillus parakribbianus TaxID=2970927 RepID=UPI0021CB0E43|nr:5-formyltetrahydrofolate cyclo-ligase [Lacticaseibacillus parakribbianus]